MRKLFQSIEEILETHAADVILAQIGKAIPGSAKMDLAVDEILRLADRHLFPFDKGEGKRVNVIAEKVTDIVLYTVVRPLVRRAMQAEYNKILDRIAEAEARLKDGDKVASVDAPGDDVSTGATKRKQKA